jgi:hypothetical protein
MFAAQARRSSDGGHDPYVAQKLREGIEPLLPGTRDSARTEERLAGHGRPNQSFQQQAPADRGWRAAMLRRSPAMAKALPAIIEELCSERIGVAQGRTKLL